jgi:hypothetical protein
VEVSLSYYRLDTSEEGGWTQRIEQYRVNSHIEAAKYKQ